jgi:pyruvate/oxaloacetate carboxyltransferase
MANETLKQEIIKLVELLYDKDPTELDSILNETNVTPDSAAMHQRAAELIKPAADKENALQILNDFL